MKQSKLTEKQILEGCRKCKLDAQKALYNQFAPKMRSVCIRYSNSRVDAEDILQEGFLKVFQNISQYKEIGSLEGWIKRIIINTALYFYKKKKNTELYNFDSIAENDIDESISDEHIEDFDLTNKSDFNSLSEQEAILQADFSKEEITEALNTLKDEFKVVFNLYYIEDFKHKQIAEMLGIDESTSRTRLLRAKKKIQKELFAQCKSKFLI
ncbi:MAG: RNA polymerase sigma factor [Bacteroidales bacterium]|nr:RNA polymerase sigma factor [Bacteroidales bacterium]